MKSLAFNYLSTPDKDSGLSYLQLACIRGDVDTVSAILNYSPDKLDSAIAFSIKIGWNASRYAGKSIYTVLRQRDSKEHRQISEFVEKVTKHFQGQSLLHLAAKRGQVEHVRRVLDCGEDVNFRMPDYLALKETPLMLAARFNVVDVVEFLVERGASLEYEDDMGFTALHHAAMGGKSENILRLIEFGCKASKVNYHKSSAIHLAAENGHTEAVRLLLEHGASVKKANCFCMTPLTLALKNGHLETIQLLLKNGCDFSVVSDEAGRLPIHYAVEGGHVDVVKLVLQSNPSVLSKTNDGDTVLHLATSLEVVRLLVEQGADIHARNYYSKTVLHAAAEKGQSDTITYLLDQGVDINARDDAGHSPLFDAVYSERGDAAKVLISRDCDLKVRSTNEGFPDGYREDDVFMEAAATGLTDVLQLLVEKGFSAIDEANRYGDTPLSVAAAGGHYDAVVFLLDKGANINGGTAAQLENSTEIKSDNSDDEGEDDEEGEIDKYWYCPEESISPLYRALYAGQIEVAKLLIKRGANTSACMRDSFDLGNLADLAAKDADLAQLLSDSGVTFDKSEIDETPLTMALSREEYHSITHLLERGEDVNARNVRGDTALSILLQYAEPTRAMEIVKLLIKYGADINIKNGRSETPLQIACSANLDKVAELFLEHGCEANVHGANLNFSPLHHAAERNNSRLVRTLLQYGACSKEKSYRDKWTPLHAAVSSNSLDAAKLLLEHGVDLEAKDSSGCTVLFEAVGLGCLPMIELLLHHGSNVHTMDKHGKSLLFHALESMRFLDPETVELTNIIRILLDRGCSVKSTDEYGRSPLYYLPQMATREICELLVNHGAELNLRDINGETQLHFAAKDGNTAVIEWLLEQEADVTSLDKEDRTPLHAAAYEGHVSSVELLIGRGADVNSADKRGWTPLHFAAAGGQLGSGESLVQNGSDVAAVDKKGRTALFLAAKYGCREIVEFLIRHEGDVNSTPLNGQTILGATEESNFLDKVLIEVFLESGCDLHAVDKVTGRTVLHFAATSGNVTSLNRILDQGLDLKAKDKNGDTPLHRAAARGTLEIVQRLIEKGAEIMAVNNKGQTPFLVAVAVGFKKVAEVLLKQGSNVQVADIDGNTPLHFAVNLPRLLKRIIRNGGDVNAVNVNGCTPLHRASFSENMSTVDTMKLLLKADADIHRRDNQGNTPLHIAVTGYRIEKVVDVFIEYGGDFNASNLQGRTCLHFMSTFSCCSANCIEKVLKHGSQVNAVDELGNTPLHLAVQENNLVITKGLLKHGADPGAVDYKGSTPLHVGCFSGSSKAVSVVTDYKRYAVGFELFDF